MVITFHTEVRFKRITYRDVLLIFIFSISYVSVRIRTIKEPLSMYKVRWASACLAYGKVGQSIVEASSAEYLCEGGILYL